MEEFPNDKSMNLANVFSNTKMERLGQFICWKHGCVVDVCYVLCIICLQLQIIRASYLSKTRTWFLKRGFVKEHGQVTILYLTKFLQENWARCLNKSCNQTLAPTSYLPTNGSLKPKCEQFLKTWDANT